MVSVERWSGNRGFSCVVEYTMESLINCLAAVETLDHLQLFLVQRTQSNRKHQLYKKQLQMIECLSSC